MSKKENIKFAPLVMKFDALLKFLIICIKQTRLQVTHVSQELRRAAKTHLVIVQRYKREQKIVLNIF